MRHDTTKPSRESVLAAEQARCEALERDDFDALDRLVAPDITDTHTRGVTDDHEQYLRYVRDELKFLECRRGDLQVRLIGNLAVMTGTMRNVVRKRARTRASTRRRRYCRSGTGARRAGS